MLSLRWSTMTRPRNDEHSTEFGLWLRQQPEIASSLGYAATNIDYIWCDYKRNKWMLIEEKRFMSGTTFSQDKLIQRVVSACKDDPTFCGFHLLQFEKTSPLDGKVFWNGSQIFRDEMMTMLRFGE